MNLVSEIINNIRMRRLDKEGESEYIEQEE
uniref:Tubulin n=1 Tax=Onchocerca volvulus TaxID=6282 RepID=Q25603_ONCVO|nr:tubulin [Onchocerca volvulus]